MAKRRGAKSADRSRSKEYQRVARHFLEAAKDSMDLEYWTAAAVLIVHAAIAFADAVCIKLSGQRSSGENHDLTIMLLEQAVADDDEKMKAINQLRYIIEEKTRVSYLGEILSPAETKELWKRLERFSGWAEGILNR